MTEIILVRHAKSYANVRDFAFGNETSPLTEEGIVQATALGTAFLDEYGIDPTTYEQPVLASEFIRPQQTARYAGFRHIEVDSLVNESNLESLDMNGAEAVKKHLKEGWVPDETYERARRFIALVRSGDLGYQIYFTHGLFIASVLTGLSHEGQRYEASLKRGLIPSLATITKVML
jgi:broad specificity phosphatase PhoE